MGRKYGVLREIPFRAQTVNTWYIHIYICYRYHGLSIRRVRHACCIRTGRAINRAIRKLIYEKWNLWNGAKVNSTSKFTAAAYIIFCSASKNFYYLFLLLLNCFVQINISHKFAFTTINSVPLGLELLCRNVKCYFYTDRRALLKQRYYNIHFNSFCQGN